MSNDIGGQLTGLEGEIGCSSKRFLSTLNVLRAVCAVSPFCLNKNVADITEFYFRQQKARCQAALMLAINSYMLQFRKNMDR